MVTINVSNDTRVKLLNMKTADIGSIEKVILNAIENPNAIIQSTSVDYSQCPNCDKLQNAIYAQESTIDGKTKHIADLGVDISMLKADVKAEKELVKEAQNGGSEPDDNYNVMYDGLTKEINGLKEENNRLVDKNNKEIAYRDNEESQPHMTGGK